MEIEKLLTLIWNGRLGVFADLAIGTLLLMIALMLLLIWVKHLVENG